MAACAVHFFGIRHHGPGCARSLLSALAALDPECVLLEGPPEANAIVQHAGNWDMRPPVAVLIFDAARPQAAQFNPFGEFSPEWQALRWALAHGRRVRFIDLPASHRLALLQRDEPDDTDRDPLPGPPEADEGLGQRRPPAQGCDALGQDEGSVHGHDPGDDPGHDADPALPEPMAPAATAEESAAAECRNPEAAASDLGARARQDPIGLLAHLAGYSDGESWWNQLIEERTHPATVFRSLEMALTTLRDAAEQDRESLCGPDLTACAALEAEREAHMRLEIHKAVKDFDGPVAVITGAWHTPALRRTVKISTDRALLRGLPKVNTVATWVPWTHTRLARASGYGAGVTAPGWYQHLWRNNAAEHPGARIAASWARRAAELLRQRGLPVSTAQIIETTRLAQTLAAMQDRPNPGLDDVSDALLATMAGGQPATLHAIATPLLIGDDVGDVGALTPQNPLEVDLARQQRALRLKREGLERPMSVDLRTKAGTAKSVLLHRLGILGVHWGQLSEAGRSRGTFRENWVLRWDPEFSVTLAEALVYGTTIETAAGAKLVQCIDSETDLRVLADRVLESLAADLPHAAQACINRLQAVASQAVELIGALEAVPSLANVLRYGSARAIPTEPLRRLVTSLSSQITAGLVYACRHLQAEVTKRTYRAIEGFDHALDLLDDGALSQAWSDSLAMVACDQHAVARLKGLATRRLHDRSAFKAETTQRLFSQALSPTQPPEAMAEWLEGFLAEEGQVLLLDRTLLEIMEAWVAGLDSASLLAILPMLRRAFSTLAAHERRALLTHIAEGSSATATPPECGDDAAANPAAFDAAIPLLKTILGLAR